MKATVLILALLLVSPAFGQASNQCVTCHRAVGASLVERFESSAHAAAGVACSACHGGDPAAITAAGGHATEHDFVARPTAVATAVRCGSCHTEAGAAFARGPHQAALAFTGTPTCTACHEPHHTQIPTDAARACGQCHAEDGDPAHSVVSAMVAGVGRANDIVGQLDAALGQTSTHGEAKHRLLVAEMRRANAARAHLRRVSHSADAGETHIALQQLDEHVAVALAVAGADLSPDRGFSRATAMLILVGLGLLLLVGSAALVFLGNRMVRRTRRKQAAVAAEISS